MNALEKTSDELISLSQEKKNIEEFREKHGEYRKNQNTLAKSLAKEDFHLRHDPAGETKGKQWLVTDFVTFGSPLSYAHMLLTEKVEHFSRRVFRYRDYPINPPVWTTPTDTKELKTYRIKVEENDSGSSDDIVMHPAAVFAPVRWTNLYFTTCGILDGDIIGGAVHGYIGAIEVDQRSPRRGDEAIGRMGSGILDIQLSAAPFTENGLLGERFLHTEYWKGSRIKGYPKDPDRQNSHKNNKQYEEDAERIKKDQTSILKSAKHLRALRVAFNLIDQDESRLWLAYMEDDAGLEVTREPLLPIKKAASENAASYRD